VYVNCAGVSLRSQWVDVFLWQSCPVPIHSWSTVIRSTTQLLSFIQLLARNNSDICCRCHDWGWD